uniref:Uncharacterized protein n=1 Tax=Coccidioides posadasii RMSCC 3488 TaxID=454284 RepID=A0A0J6F8Z9_COCPO|nr:hypothetical protein CPAG_02083 [Coccidioides posadasii RMSCC 3488]
MTRLRMEWNCARSEQAGFYCLSRCPTLSASFSGLHTHQLPRGEYKDAIWKEQFPRSVLLSVISSSGGKISKGQHHLATLGSIRLLAGSPSFPIAASEKLIK